MGRWNKKVGVYMDETMHRLLSQEAKRREVDMSWIARRLIEEHLREQFKERGEEYPGQQVLAYEDTAAEVASHG